MFTVAMVFKVQDIVEKNVRKPGSKDVKDL